jgi:hypothetical protein
MGQVVASVANGEVVLRIPLGQDQQPAVVAVAVQSPRPVDFSRRSWKGQSFSSNKRQARIVEALWHARDEGVPWLTSEQLHRSAAIEQGHFVKAIFAGHPAWGAFVLSAEDIGGGPGSYRLAAD